MTSVTDELRLAADFQPSTYDDWRKLVDGVLKGAPFEKLVSPSDPNPSSTAVVTHTRRGLAATRSPMRCHSPWVSSAPSEPKLGTTARTRGARRAPAPPATA